MSEKQEPQQKQQGQPQTESGNRGDDNAANVESREEMLDKSKAEGDERAEDEITGAGTGSRGGEYS